MHLGVDRRFLGAASRSWPWRETRSANSTVENARPGGLTETARRRQFDHHRTSCGIESASQQFYRHAAGRITGIFKSGAMCDKGFSSPGLREYHRRRSAGRSGPANDRRCPNPSPSIPDELAQKIRASKLRSRERKQVTTF
jgi:hypothetical protein